MCQGEKNNLISSLHMPGAEGRLGKPFGQPVFQQYGERSAPGTPGLGRGERRGRGQLGNPGNQTNPLVQRLIGEIGKGEQLPGDERAKIERINSVYYLLSGLRRLTAYRGDPEHNADVEPYWEYRDNIRYVDAAVGLLTYDKLSNKNKARLFPQLRWFQTGEDSYGIIGGTGRFILTPQQNEIVEQVTAFLGVPYDRQKTQYTYSVVEKGLEVEVTSIIEVPTVIEGK